MLESSPNSGIPSRQRYLRPGVVWRLPINDLVIIGQGPERNNVNTTANLYSCLIAENYVAPSLLISPIEVNRRVREDRDYNYDVIDLMNGVFWDPDFKANIAARIGESNTSYAHLGLCGERKSKRWRDGTKYASQEPVFSNR